MKKPRFSNHVNKKAFWMIKGKHEKEWIRYEQRTGKTGLQDKTNPVVLVLFFVAVFLFGISFFTNGDSPRFLWYFGAAILVVSFAVQFISSERVYQRRNHERELSGLAPKRTRSESFRQKFAVSNEKGKGAHTRKKDREGFLDRANDEIDSL